jgi:GTP-binding protein LepA
MFILYTNRYVDTPAKLPDPSTFVSILEPYVRLEMITPTEYTGALMDLGQTRRGNYIELKYLTPTRSTLIYEALYILSYYLYEIPL